MANPIKVNKQEDVEKVLVKNYGVKSLRIKDNTLTVLVPVKSTVERVKVGKDIVGLFEGGRWSQPNPQRSGQGSIPIGKTRNIISIQVKTAKEEQDPIGETGLDPANVEPPIVGKWISPDDLIKNVLSYIKKSNITADGKKELQRIITGTQNTTSTIPFNPNESIVTSEFFEALSSVRLCALMENAKKALPPKANPTGIRKIFGIPNESELGDFMIYFPIEKGFPLVDFFVNVYPLTPKRKLPTGNPELFAGEGILRISVKNVTKSAKVNTVKFDLAFGKNKTFKPNPSLAEAWYNSIKNPTAKQKQLAQKIIAKESLRGGIDYNKNKKLAPLVALNELLNNKSFYTKIKSVLDRKYKKGPLAVQKGYVDAFLSITEMIKNRIKDINQNDLIQTYIDKDFTAADMDLIEEFLNLNFVSKSGQSKSLDFKSLAYAGDKIYEWATNEKDPAPEWNFYKLFYDKVLCEREVVYAITSSKGKILKYDFYSKLNYEQEYKSWVGLRSKGTDQLGMG